MTIPRKYDLVLAIYPNSRGFAFVLFEGSLSPVDWGIVDIRAKEKNRQALSRIGSLFCKYEPCAVILENMSGKTTRRASRIRSLNEAIAVLAETQSMPIFAYSRAHVRERFAYLGVTTKQAIAEAIARHIPAFERFLPPARKVWKSEDSRMALFDAAALMFTFFARQNGDGPA